MSATVSKLTNAVKPVAPGEPDRLAKKLGKLRKVVEIHQDPRSELRRLVQMHRDYTRSSRSYMQSVSDIERSDGTIIKCTKPDHIKADIEAVAKNLKHEADLLKKAMTAQLKKLPIYEIFLSKVDGLGPVTCAYLVAMVKIERCVKVSQLIRYCGFACDPNTGKSERRLSGSGPKHNPDGSRSGGTGTFNQDLKSALVTCFLMMRQCCAGKRETHRYLVRWNEAKHSALTIENARLGRVMRPGEADDKGRRKATDLFLWDLYVMWRTIDGLPIYADKYSTQRGVMHGGSPAWDGPRQFLIAEAEEMVHVDAWGR